MIGDHYFSEEIFTKAYLYYLRSRDVPKIILTIKEVSKFGYKSEEDLFVTRACLELLSRENTIENARKLHESYPYEQEKPTLMRNFMSLLLDGMEVKDFNFFKEVLSRY